MEVGGGRNLLEFCSCFLGVIHITEMKRTLIIGCFTQSLVKLELDQETHEISGIIMIITIKHNIDFLSLCDRVNVNVLGGNFSF